MKLPNVDPLMEALDMQEAQRAYQANLNVIETARDDGLQHPQHPDQVS